MYVYIVFELLVHVRALNHFELTENIKKVEISIEGISRRNSMCPF